MRRDMLERKVTPAGAFVGLLLSGAALWFCFGGGLERQAAKDKQRIENQVAADAVKQYEIAARNDSAVDRCVQAGIVSAAYLQAKDEENYRIWKTKEVHDCDVAGFPPP